MVLLLSNVGLPFIFRIYDNIQIMFVICRPLFAGSLLEIIRTLLEQTRQDEIRILGCNTLSDFINCQVFG